MVKWNSIWVAIFFYGRLKIVIYLWLIFQVQPHICCRWRHTSLPSARIPPVSKCNNSYEENWDSNSPPSDGCCFVTFWRVSSLTRGDGVWAETSRLTWSCGNSGSIWRNGWGGSGRLLITAPQWVGSAQNETIFHMDIEEWYDLRLPSHTSIHAISLLCVNVVLSQQQRRTNEPRHRNIAPSERRQALSAEQRALVSLYTFDQWSSYKFGSVYLLSCGCVYVGKSYVRLCSSSHFRAPEHQIGRRPQNSQWPPQQRTSSRLLFIQCWSSNAYSVPSASVSSIDHI